MWQNTQLFKNLRGILCKISPPMPRVHSNMTSFGWHFQLHLESYGCLGGGAASGGRNRSCLWCCHSGPTRGHCEPWLGEGWTQHPRNQHVFLKVLAHQVPFFADKKKLEPRETLTHSDCGEGQSTRLLCRCREMLFFTTLDPWCSQTLRRIPWNRCDKTISYSFNKNVSSSKPRPDPLHFKIDEPKQTYCFEEQT